MMNRFEGPEGRRRLAEALSRQTIVNGDQALIDRLLPVVQLKGFDVGDLLIKSGEAHSDLFFILSGKVAIEIQGLDVAVRGSGTHVGEMAAIDPAAARSASVRALEFTTTATITDDELVAIGTDIPELWRRFAIELAERLRQRTRFIRVPNDRSRLFIGCSVEMLPVARAIQAAFTHDDVSVILWTDGVFRASRDAVTNLLEVAERTDFAVLIFGPDDVVVSRGDERQVPRDNVVFELGLFIGAVGRERTFIVVPRGLDLRLPTDLLSIEPLKFATDESETVQARIAPVCSGLREHIETLGVR